MGYRLGRREYSKSYGRTFNGLTARIYHNQKHRSKIKGFNNPEYSLSELREYLSTDDVFNRLYSEWKESDYKKELTPSLDRKDDYLGYSFDNIVVKTWKSNDTRGHKDRKEGINNKVNKAVIQSSKDGSFIAEFHSVREAARQVGGNVGNIASCCRGILKSSLGFKWEYKKEGETT